MGKIMNNEHSTNTTIFNGLPCIIKGIVYHAEPDVGIFTDYIDERWLEWPSGHIIGQSVTVRITDKEWTRLEYELLETARSYDDEGI